MTTCIACGFTPKAETKPAKYCIKCGHPLTAQPSGAVAPTSPMTLIEAPSAPSAPSSPAHPSSSRVSKIQAGSLPRTIDGFEILTLLGYGGMGCVLLAYEPLLDRQVALKVLDRSGDNESRAKNAARFLSEGALTGRLSHSGIVPIYRVGHDPEVGYYYTMRLIRGRTLFDIIRQLAAKNQRACEEFTVTQLLRIFVRICDALGFAHNEGILHRDIKPANVMVTDFGEVFVVDWGLAKSIGAIRQEEKDGTAMLRLSDCRMRQAAATQLFLQKDQRTPTGNSSLLRRLQGMRPASSAHPMTHQSQILGTPGFLSPEQASGTACDPSSDVYSLGVTLYELLTYQLPVKGPTAEQSIVQTMTGQIIPIKEHPQGARLPNAICEIVMRALALDPKNRYANALELGREIALYLDGRTPWKPIVRTSFADAALTPDFKLISGSPVVEGQTLLLSEGAKVQAVRTSPGDFCCEFEFWAAPTGQRWEVAVGVGEVTATHAIEARYEVRLGMNGGSFAELHRSGIRVRRRLDVRMTPGHRYRVKLELEQSHLRLSLNEKPCITFTDVFPQTGGSIEFACVHGQIHIASLEWLTRGAPLQLSFMSLPDRLYRTGRFADARELYRQLASSHPDREEGLLAQYKAGLCSTALKDFQTAFDEFTKLEGTMLEHCCGLGLAQIGMQDGNIDWAWEALKNGYGANVDEEIRTEMWFALLALIETIPEDRQEEKISRYNQLLNDVSPDPHEAAHLVLNLLAAVQAARGQSAVRSEALSLLERFPDHAFVSRVALSALGRAGIPKTSLDRVAQALDEVLKSVPDDASKADLHILRAEVYLAGNELDEAARQLRDAVLLSDAVSPAGLWARSWQALVQYLKLDYMAALTDIHSILARCRKMQSPQISYLRLLDGICYLARKQKGHASAAFRACAEENSVWSAVARNFLAGSAAEELERGIAYASPAQISEALFLAGEAYWHAENTELAYAHFMRCANAPEARALTHRLAAARLEMRRDNAGTCH
jgi:serine/threonine protein kinase